MAHYGNLYPGMSKQTSRSADPVADLPPLLQTQAALGLDEGTVQVAGRSVVLATGELREEPKRRKRAVFTRVDVGSDGTPSSNTGCQSSTGDQPVNQQPDQPARVLVDYLACTYRRQDGDHYDPEELYRPALDRALDTFGREGWVELEKGGNGYAKSLRRGDLLVLYGGSVNPDTVYVQAKGKGCRQLEEEGWISAPPGHYAMALMEQRITPWQAFLGGLLEDGVTFPRLDLAIDERAGRLDLEVVQRAIGGGHYSGNFPTAYPQKEIDLRSGDAIGLSVTFGKRSSTHSTQVCMYHKGMEQYQKGEAETIEDWVRVELRFKDARAMKMVKEIVASGMQSVVRVLWAYIDFKDEDQDRPDDRHNRNRCPSATWWTSWLDAVTKLRLGCDPRIRTVAQVAEWVHRQVLPSLAVLSHAVGYGLDWLLDAIDDAAARRLGPLHIAMLQAAARSGANRATESVGFAT